MPGVVDVSFPYLALAPDGTAALLFRQSDPSASILRTQIRVALLPLAQPPELRTLATSSDRPLNPGGLGVDGANRFTALWDSGYSYSGAHLKVRELDSQGHLSAVETLPVEQARQLALTALYVDAAGDRLLVWSSDARQSRLLTAERRAKARRFSRPKAVTHAAAGLLASDSNASGRTLLVWQTAQGVLAAVRRPGGKLTRPHKLAARSAATLARIDSTGTGTILFAGRTTWHSVRLSASGALGASHTLRCVPVAVAALAPNRVVIAGGCGASLTPSITGT
ncbi:MAG: hypothetical protein QOJ35_3095 [Solirubrobacteraceae bacterium]|nr:hypothetical protein [Solirubrobacteraceae bacterium]